ncbi:MAG: protease modulator HflK [Phycisphaeraceae bacterium]|nr:protease modulator HflK [Phycisphaeraceae bacterium]
MTGPQNQQTYQRAVVAALIGLLIQVGLLLASALVGLWSQSPAVYAVVWHILGGLPIWVVLLLIYQQHRLERAETLEAEQLAGTDVQGAAIFQEAADELGLARRRLERLYGWGLNLVSLLLAIYLLAIGGWLGYHHYGLLEAQAKTVAAAAVGVGAQVGPALTAANLSAIAVGPRAGAVGLGVFAVAGAFIAFASARYIAGMTRIKEWRLLRGGASYLMGQALLLAMLLVSAALGYFGNMVLVGALALVIPAIMILVGLEILLFLLLSAYRPRLPDEVPQPAFESRLLGWLTSPESLAKIINDTINYQFGFEVSRSWFYRLLGRAVTPLLFIAVAVLLFMSSIVIVEPDQRAVITRFGALVDQVGPGRHWKWPWPIGAAQKFPVDQIKQITVGTESAHKPRSDHEPETAILWTNKHTEADEAFQIAAPTPLPADLDQSPASAPAPGSTPAPGSENALLAPVAAPPAEHRAPGMTLVAAEVIVQYRVRDLETYVATVDDPVRLLGALAQRRVHEAFVSTDIDQLLSKQRLDLGDRLRGEIQADVDEYRLGLEVIFVGVNGVHPPQASDVAKAFHEQINSLQEKEALIEKARKDATATLAGVAGSIDKALSLDQAIRQLQNLTDQLTSAQATAPKSPATASLAGQLAEQQVLVDRLLTEARGQAAERLYDALAYRWERELTERGKAHRFFAQIDAYRRAPQFYKARLYLEALTEVMPLTRRFIVPDTAQFPGLTGVIRLNLHDPQSGLSTILQPEQP